MSPLPGCEGELNGVRGVHPENLLHLAGHVGVEDLEIDLVVTKQADPVEVGRTDGGPLAVNGCRLGVNHRALVEKQPDSVAQQITVVAARQPVRDDVVGFSRHDDPDIHPARRRVDQGVQHVLVRDQVGVGEVDVVGGPVEGLEVHTANGVHHVARDVAMDPDVRLPAPRAEVWEGGATSTGEDVPVVDERVLNVPDDVACEAGMCVAPVRRVQGPDVVATEEGDQIVHDEQFAVITPAVARKAEAAGNDRVRADGDVARQEEEGLRYDEIGELVVNHIDLDTPVGRLDQSRLERLTDSVGLPDEGLEEDPGLGLSDGVQHVGVEVLAVGVDRYLRAAGGDRAGRDARESRRYAMALAPVVHHGERAQGCRLDNQYGQHDASKDGAHRDAPDQHAIQSSPCPVTDPGLCRAAREADLDAAREADLDAAGEADLDAAGEADLAVSPTASRVVQS